MRLTGRHTLNATVATLWIKLMDTDTLTRIVPGITRLEQTGEHTFKSFIDLKMGLVNGSFTGDLRLENIAELKSCTLNLHQSSTIGKANGIINIELMPVDDNQSEISFDGEIKLAGLLASMGQRVLGGVANMLTKKFFLNLGKELEKE